MSPTFWSEIISRGRVQGVRTPLSTPEMTCGFLIQLVFCKEKTMWFIGVQVEQETSAPPPKKNPGSAPAGPLKQKILGRHNRNFVRRITLQSPAAPFTFSKDDIIIIIIIKDIYLSIYLGEYYFY